MSKKLTDEVCRFFPNCSKGDSCQYVHPVGTSNNASGVFGGKSTVFGSTSSPFQNSIGNKKEIECVYFKKGMCNKGEACDFKHTGSQNAAPTTSAFGSNSTFGNNQNSTEKKPQGSLFGQIGAPTTVGVQGGASLFGGIKPQLIGTNPISTSTATPSSGNLFSKGASLFSNSNANNTNQTSTIFGSTTPQKQNEQPKSVFGQVQANTSQNQPATTFGLFSGQQNANAKQTSLPSQLQPLNQSNPLTKESNPVSLFSGQTQPTSLFGKPITQQPSIFGGVPASFGQTTTQPLTQNAQNSTVVGFGAKQPPVPSLIQNTPVNQTTTPSTSTTTAPASVQLSALEEMKKKALQQMKERQALQASNTTTTSNSENSNNNTVLSQNQPKADVNKVSITGAQGQQQNKQTQQTPISQVQEQTPQQTAPAVGLLQQKQQPPPQVMNVNAMKISQVHQLNQQMMQNKQQSKKKGKQGAQANQQHQQANVQQQQQPPSRKVEQINTPQTQAQSETKQPLNTKATLMNIAQLQKEKQEQEKKNKEELQRKRQIALAQSLVADKQSMPQGTINNPSNTTQQNVIEQQNPENVEMKDQCVPLTKPPALINQAVAKDNLLKNTVQQQVPVQIKENQQPQAQESQRMEVDTENTSNQINLGKRKSPEDRQDTQDQEAKSQVQSNPGREQENEQGQRKRLKSDDKLLSQPMPQAIANPPQQLIEQANPENVEMAEPKPEKKLNPERKQFIKKIILFQKQRILKDDDFQEFEVNSILDSHIQKPVFTFNDIIQVYSQTKDQISSQAQVISHPPPVKELKPQTQVQVIQPPLSQPVEEQINTSIPIPAVVQQQIEEPTPPVQQEEQSIIPSHPIQPQIISDNKTAQTMTQIQTNLGSHQPTSSQQALLVPQQAKKKITQAQIMQEIEEFNQLLDKLQARLQLKMPQISVQSEEDKEHDRLVSFQTKVDCLVDFFDNQAETLTEKIISGLGGRKQNAAM
eukprot:403365750